MIEEFIDNNPELSICIVLIIWFLAMEGLAFWFWWTERKEWNNDPGE